MRFSNRILFYGVSVIAAMLLACSCNGGKPSVDGNRTLWMAYSENHDRLANHDSLCFYLDKAKETGFTQIVVDVMGDDISSYLSPIIHEAHDRKLSVLISMMPFYVSKPCEGTCLEYTPQGMMKMEDDPSEYTLFLNPADPANQERGLQVVRDMLSSYDVDGFVLDYCRYPGQKSDFSDVSKRAFEQYLGHPVEDFPQSIFTYGPAGEMVPGPYFQAWWSHRAILIKDYIARIRDLRDELKPDCTMEYWAASWLHALYKNGQNWASSESTWYASQSWADRNYGEAGFAELLDVFIVGTYLEEVWGIDNNVSVEYGLMRTNRDIAGACRIQGSIYAINHLPQFADACYLCLRETGGLMVFDMCQVISNDLWDEISEGINRARRERLI